MGEYMGVVCWHCWSMKAITLLLCMITLATCDFVGHQQEDRSGRQEDGIQGGVDFSGCTTDQETGLCCVEKEETVTSIEKDPILECTHKDTEQCHYTYVTQFKPSQEEVCEENFEKSCQITFKQQAYNETVRKCYSLWGIPAVKSFPLKFVGLAVLMRKEKRSVMTRPS